MQTAKQCWDENWSRIVQRLLQLLLKLPWAYGTEARDAAANHKFNVHITIKTLSGTKWFYPRHKSFRVSKAFDAMQRLVFPLTHFKANGTKISQKCVQCIATQAWLVFHVYGKMPQTKHCSLWNRIQAWKTIVLFQFAWISSVACWLAASPFWLLTNSICTRDATSSREADGNKPSIITSNKQDAINCLPHQLKYVPWYSMRTSD